MQIYAALLSKIMKGMSTFASANTKSIFAYSVFIGDGESDQILRPHRLR